MNPQPTHTMKCTHYQGRNKVDYIVNVALISETPQGRAKVLFFPERVFKGAGQQPSVRYVDKARLNPIK